MDRLKAGLHIAIARRQAIHSTAAVASDRAALTKSAGVGAGAVSDRTDGNRIGRTQIAVGITEVIWRAGRQATGAARRVGSNPRRVYAYTSFTCTKTRTLTRARPSVAARPKPEDPRQTAIPPVHAWWPQVWWRCTGDISQGTHSESYGDGKALRFIDRIPIMVFVRAVFTARVL